MFRFLKYLVLVAAIASLAPFVIPDGKGGRLFSWDTLTLPDLDVPLVGGDGAGASGNGEGQPETVYKWRDGAGRWHYGDQPPPGVDAQPMKLRPDVNVLPAPEVAPREGERGDGSLLPNPLQQARDAAEISERRMQHLDEAIETQDAGR